MLLKCINEYTKESILYASVFIYLFISIATKHFRHFIFPAKWFTIFTSILFWQTHLTYDWLRILHFIRTINMIKFSCVLFVCSNGAIAVAIVEFFCYIAALFAQSKYTFGRKKNSIATFLNGTFLWLFEYLGSIHLSMHHHAFISFYSYIFF